MSRDGRPDLVLVMTDQQRFDQVGYAAQGPVRTPNIDRLAAGGVIFEHAYSASTTCVPARTSLLTGLLDHRVRYAERFSLQQGFWTVPHALRAAGYETALIGKMHFNPIRADHGFEHMRLCEHLDAYAQPPQTRTDFDHYHDWLQSLGLKDWRYEVPGGSGAIYPYDISTHPTEWVRDETISFLGQRTGNRPLFLVVSFPHPHPPVNPPEPYASLYDPDDCPIDPNGAEANVRLPSSFRVATAQAEAPRRRIDPDRLAIDRRQLALTYGLITQIDDAVGQVVDHLDLTDALLFFTADHGDYAGHRGLIRKIPWIPFDDLARVPCFATGGVVRGGRREPNPMQSFDFAVTCLAYAGIDVPDACFDGVDLQPILSDAEATMAEDRLVFSAISMKWPMVRRGPHKYIRALGRGAEVLFDVERDPGETWNLIHLDGAGDLIGELAAAVDRQLVAVVPDLPSFPVTRKH
ncbi:MAG: sulfatase-like hydrolase/transferase [Acidimicrobiales bacterium]